MDAHDLIDRDMQIVVEAHVVRRAKLGIGSRINDFPVKLLGSHLNLKVRRRHAALHLGPSRYAHEGQYDQNRGRNNGPNNLKRRVAVGVDGPPPRLFTVFHQKYDHQYGYEDKGRGRDVVNEVE